MIAIDDSIDNDPNYVAIALDIEGEEEYDDDGGHDDGDYVDQYDEFG